VAVGFEPEVCRNHCRGVVGVVLRTLASAHGPHAKLSEVGKQRLSGDELAAASKLVPDFFNGHISPFSLVGLITDAFTVALVPHVALVCQY